MEELGEHGCWTYGGRPRVGGVSYLTAQPKRSPPLVRALTCVMCGRPAPLEATVQGLTQGLYPAFFCRHGRHMGGLFSKGVAERSVIRGLVGQTVRGVPVSLVPWDEFCFEPDKTPLLATPPLG